MKDRGNLSGSEDEGRASNGEKSKRRHSAKAELLSRSVFSHSVSLLSPPEPCLTLSSTELRCREFRLQSVTLVPNRRRSFTTSSPDIPTYSDGMIDPRVQKKKEGILGGCAYAERVGGALTFEGG